MILHFSHIGFTDGRTFMIPFKRCLGPVPALAAAEAAAAATRMARTQGHADARTVDDSKGALSAALRFGGEPGGRARGQTAFSPSCQGVRTRGPSAVTAIVNSKCAAREPSCE